MSIVTVSTSTPITKPASGDWVRRRPLLAMYVLMFALAWAVLVPQALASRGLLAFQVPMAVSLLAGWGGAASFVMISISNPLWRHLPKLQFVQLPWRWLLSRKCYCSMNPLERLMR
jgi:hypothetical protein